MDIFCNCTFSPLIGHPRHLCAIHKMLYHIKQIIKFLLAMQIAITFISENVLDCIVHEDSIDHPGDDNLYSCYVIYLTGCTTVSRRIKSLITSEVQHGTGSFKSPQK